MRGRNDGKWMIVRVLFVLGTNSRGSGKATAFVQHLSTESKKLSSSGSNTRLYSSYLDSLGSGSQSGQNQRDNTNIAAQNTIGVNNNAASSTQRTETRYAEPNDNYQSGVRHFDPNSHVNNFPRDRPASNLARSPQQQQQLNRPYRPPHVNDRDYYFPTQRYNPRTGWIGNDNLNPENRRRISPSEIYSPSRRQNVYRDDFRPPPEAPFTETPTTTVQGNHRTTWSSDPYFYSSNPSPTLVTIKTDGRPMDGEFELFEGPDNVPQKVRVFSEDGFHRPFQTLVQPRKGVSHTMSVRNAGPMEFPLRAGVRQAHNHRRVSTAPYRNFGQPEGASPPVTVQGGGALKTFQVGHGVQQVLVEIKSEGLPIMAVVELWEGPGRSKQIAEVYNDDGYARPFSAVIDTTGWYGATIAVRNTGHIEFPFTARVSPYS